MDSPLFRRLFISFLFVLLGAAASIAWRAGAFHPGAVREAPWLLSSAVLIFVAGALAAGAAWYVGRRATGIARAAERIGLGELDARAPDLPADELGELGHELNRMAERLERRIADLGRERDQREHILAHMSDGVALLNSDGRVIHANDGVGAILGLDRAPASRSRLLDEARQPALADLLARARTATEAVSEEIDLYSPRQLTLEATVLRLGEGTAAAYLVVLHDLSRIRQLETVRREFVANVSHELRTPLTLIRGCAETLLDGGMDDVAHRRQFVETIERHAVRLQGIVDDLLSLARLEQPGAALEGRPVDLVAMVREVAAGFEHAAAQKGIALAVESAEPATHVMGDPRLLERVVVNLVDNAVKYTERGNVVIAVGRRDSGGAWCEVRDTGPGVAREHLPRIFERFYRVDRGRSRDLGGTGLGLSIVKHAVEQMGGTVAATSEPGQGTTFRIELPYAAG